MFIKKMNYGLLFFEKYYKDTKKAIIKYINYSL